MRKMAALLACALAAGACKENEASKPAARKVTTRSIPETVTGKETAVIPEDVFNVLEKSALGSKLSSDGTVSTEATKFKPGEPVSLTVWLRQSPPHLSVGVRWFAGADSKPLTRDQREMNGGKVATFTLNQKLKPGRYRAEAYWGGNLVAVRKFDVAARKR
jgi:hypothetical protein